MRPLAGRCSLLIFCGLLLATISIPAFGASSVHGLWVWKSQSVLESPQAAETLRDFCQAQGINEVYVSVSTRNTAEDDGRLARLIALLHRSNIRVEALLSSENADEGGKHLDKLLDHVRQVIHFNQHQPDRFDGIHLDIEPQQRPENKGPGNLRFLPGLVDAYRAVHSQAASAHMPINADIQNKLLKGDLIQRRMLMSSLPRLTLMLYEVSSPEDGDSAAQKAAKISPASQKFLDLAYEGLDNSNLAKMIIALRTPDYGDLLPQMLKTLDDTHRSDPRYIGWARHSYNDYLKTSQLKISCKIQTVGGLQ
jgi:hypothetical protein